jgi:hypothetical protein
MASGDIVDLAVADSVLSKLSENLVDHSNYWLVLLADTLLLAEWRLCS